MKAEKGQGACASTLETADPPIHKISRKPELINLLRSTFPILDIDITYSIYLSPKIQEDSGGVAGKDKLFTVRAEFTSLLSPASTSFVRCPIAALYSSMNNVSHIFQSTVRAFSIFAQSSIPD